MHFQLPEIVNLLSQMCVISYYYLERQHILFTDKILLLKLFAAIKKR